MARDLVIKIVGDSSSFERALRRSSSDAKRFEMSITGIGRSMRGAFAGAATAVGVGFGAAAAVDQLKSMVNAASDLNEQVGKTKVVFGASSDAVTEWSKTLATTFALSQRQALTAASSYGALLRPLGLTG